MTGATILGLAGPVLTADEAAFFRAADPWGFILFRRNVGDAAQLRRLTSALREAVARDAPVFMDQEGGTVQRLRPPLALDWPDASAQPGGAAAVFLRHRLMAAELRACGIDGNCAPVIDVAGPLTHPFLQRRIWSADPATVTTLCRAAAQGLLAGGVLPVIKHLPGHGAANADSHHALPRCPLPLADLEARDFVPVRALAYLPLGMSGHMVIEALDPENPATHSAKVITYLRRSLGFGGLLMTDDLGMNALGGTMGERTAAALGAGCDVALHCSGDMAEMEDAVAAAGHLTPAANQRAAAALAARKPPEPVDIVGLHADFARLSNPAA